jgi:UDP-N-acetylglucosamine 2-epimerase (non-hydrolysing)
VAPTPRLRRARRRAAGDAGAGGPARGDGGRLHVFLGTKAQYIKTAPLLRLLDERGVDYRLIDSGQHAKLSVGMRADLGVRAPDHVLGGTRDVDSIPQAAVWAAGLGARLWSPARLRREVFGGAGGICVVHGDTPSTLLSTLMARRAGLTVAHLEAGLRSHSLRHPFPEELIRVVVMRLAGILFAPDDEAVANLAAMRVKGRVVPLSANTSVDAVRFATAGAAPGVPGAAGPAAGPAVVLMHRVENLHSRRVVQQFTETVAGIAAERPVRFVVHGPTREALARSSSLATLEQAGVDIVGLLPHPEFVALLQAAPFVITDGGSIQEECALLGVPTLLWRARTERPHGLGANVVLSRYDPAVVADFLADPERRRRPPLVHGGPSPTEQILDVLLASLDP